nr:hypothetical protein [uncultured Draconibacterium sp.]
MENEPEKIRKSDFEIFKNIFRKISPFLFVISIIVIILAVTDTLDRFVYLAIVEKPELLISVLGALITGVAMFKYLEGNKKKSLNIEFDKKNPSTGADTKDIKSLRNEFNSLNKKIDSLSKSFEFGVKEMLNNQDKQEITDALKKQIEENLNKDFFKILDDNYSENVILDKRLADLLEYYENISYRVNKEILKLSRRTNLNLTIGAITTLFAVAFLGYAVLNSTLDFDNLTKFWIHFLPRISVVIFIEIFAFFFLKLYKSNLEDIKYYQNELTNIEFKIASIKTAFMIEDTELTKSLTKDYSTTERNFVLKKDESTIDIERAKVDNKNNSKIFGFAEKIINKGLE